MNQSKTLLGLILKSFDLRRFQCTPRTEESYEDSELDEVEKSVNEVAIKMIYKLNDAAFRPLFTSMLEWAAASSTKKDKEGKIYRQITWYTFLLSFFDTLQVCLFSVPIGGSCWLIKGSVNRDKLCQLHNRGRGRSSKQYFPRSS